MRFWKGVGIFVLFFVLIFFVGDNFVGAVIWEPSVVGDCVDSEILVLWDEVFVESGSGVVILKDFVVPEGACGEYIAYKNSSDGLRVLYGDFYDSSWDSSDDLYSSGKKILDSVKLYVFYGNVSSSFVENFVGQTNVSVMKSMILNIGDGDVGDWSILSEDDVKSKFGELFGFVDVSGISFSSNVSGFYFSESDDFEGGSLFFSLVSRKNDALFSVEYWKDNYDPSFFAEFLGNIENFTFLKDSGWNFAFDFRDYFNVSEGIDVEFDYVGENNVGGAWINYSLNGSNVSFAPAFGFSGWREFRLVARSDGGDVVSNNFIVTIQRYNEAPFLSEIIPIIYVAAGGSKSVDLSYYFYDEDDLSYGVVGDIGVDVSFAGSVMKVSVDSNFSGYSKFKVYAFDGLVKTFSGYVYVFLEGDENVGLILLDELNASADDENVSVDGGNFSAGVGNESGWVWLDGSGWVFWGIVVFVVLVFVGGVVFFVYFFVLRKNREVVSESAVAPRVSSSAEEYIKRLGLIKK